MAIMVLYVKKSDAKMTAISVVTVRTKVSVFVTHIGVPVAVENINYVNLKIFSILVLAATHPLNLISALLATYRDAKMIATNMERVPIRAVVVTLDGQVNGARLTHVLIIANPMESVRTALACATLDSLEKIATGQRIFLRFRSVQIICRTIVQRIRNAINPKDNAMLQIMLSKLIGEPLCLISSRWLSPPSQHHLPRRRQIKSLITIQTPFGRVAFATQLAT
jgi:hypothetical protein